MSAFNIWAAFTCTTLDDSSLMLGQIQKLNDAHITLENNDISLSTLQFCFILIKSLPDSYATIAATILATGEPKNLSPQMIQDRILNEEGRRSGASGSLNKIAPIKKQGDKSKVKCFYCQKSRHKSNVCKKKKRDTEEKQKKDKDKDKGSSTQTSKSVNMHVNTATIEEISDNEDFSVSLYTAAQSHWMVDSSAILYIK